MTRIWAGLLLGLCGLAGAASRAPAAAEHGMVVSAQHLATRVGVDVLRSGGNAIDAAVAVGYALAVVYPAAGNLGGGGFMTIRLSDGTNAFLDFREAAPAAARRDMYLDAQGRALEAASTRGYSSVAVPGTVAGLELARARFGTRPRAALLEGAIALADEGFVLDQGDADMLVESAAADMLRDAPAAAVFLPGGRPPRAGERLVQKDLARTLRRIRDRGAEGFYRGPVAEAIVAASRAGGGILAPEDFAQYRAKWREPIECDYRGYHLVTAPPPSSGGVVLCEMLHILEGEPLRDLGFRSARAVHWQIEAMRIAFLDRNRSLGDPDFVDNPVARLIDPQYGARMHAAIDPARAGSAGAGELPREGSNTTHYSIVDAWGNAVAVTYTLNEWFGARVMARGTGVLLNDEMDDFRSGPGLSNSYGLVQGEANAIAPGKRPLSSMSPTIVTKDGATLLVLGTPGGSRIPTAVLHVLLNVIDYGMDIQEAIDAPRFHQQWMPEPTDLEEYALGPDTVAILRGMGHRFTSIGKRGHLAAILLGAPAIGARPVGANRFYGAIDPRRKSGLAAGY
jgi:gamma-glutamyltranspeptidase/glutathione hydrolase